ncbi:hypothetical protein K3495_g14190 [Podosphaera aphanis]|nr:hypothetical protein K3495_g14190 [Podosphaera aphanis]
MDRLSKGVIADVLKNSDSETVARWFNRNYLPHHFFPRAVVSNRGSQLTNALWKRLCEMLKIKRGLSTAFSPETDGSIERMNEIIETTLRQYVNWDQNDWAQWLPIVVSSICAKDSTSMGTDSIFLSHGWDQNLYENLEETLSDEDKRISLVARADLIVRKLTQVRDWAKVSMAAAQESQERSSNKYSEQGSNYKVGDKV